MLRVYKLNLLLTSKKKRGVFEVEFLYTKIMKKRLQQREFLFILTLLVIVITAFFVWESNKKDGEYKPGISAINDRAVNTALMVYESQKKIKKDISDGPCLSNDLMDDWVADLVHEPRILEDDLIENQCAAFIDGTATHFVEVDLKGNIVRVK